MVYRPGGMYIKDGKVIGSRRPTVKRVTEKKKLDWVAQLIRIGDQANRIAIEVESCEDIDPVKVDHLLSLSCEVEEAIGEVQDLCL